MKKDDLKPYPYEGNHNEKQFERWVTEDKYIVDTQDARLLGFLWGIGLMSIVGIIAMMWMS